MASRSRSTAVERPVEAQVPDLIRTPALDIGAEDVALPRLHIGQFSSAAVQDDLIEKGTLFSAVGQDDPAPVQLEQPLRLHVLSLRKGKSYSEDGGDLQRFEYNDPDAPQGAWVTYDYALALPEFDTDVPYKLLLTRSGRPAAQQMNTVLLRNTLAAPSWHLAFDLTTAFRENNKGKFWIPQIRQVDADPAHVAVAEHLASMMSSRAVEANATGDAPDI